MPRSHILVSGYGYNPCPSDKNSVCKALIRWKKLSLLVRHKTYIGPTTQHSVIDLLLEIEGPEPSDETFCRWFLCRIDQFNLKIQCRSRRLVVSFEDIAVSFNSGIDSTGLSFISCSEEEMVKYIRAEDPAIFEGKRIIELGAGVNAPAFSLR